MGHIHAAAMAEYAKDALETDKPWERWEFSCGISYSASQVIWWEQPTVGTVVSLQNFTIVSPT